MKSKIKADAAPAIGQNALEASGRLALRFGDWRSGKLVYSNRVLAVADVGDASRKWKQIRDFENWGVSQSPIVIVVDTVTTQPVCKVSYNGRLWGLDGKEILCAS